MSEIKEGKRTKSFSLKNKNADKIEEIAFKKKKKQSCVVDEMVEDLDGDR